tara:strand:+ start:7102 stop:8067 length:966 start_codon:yes stop_codon:yes gene_type:complete
MKNIFKKVTLLGLVAFFVSCSDTDRPIDDLNEGTTRGAVLKTVRDMTSTDIRIGVEGEQVAVVVDVIDREFGDLTEKIDVYMRFQDNNNEGDENNSTEEQFVTSIPASSFDFSGQYPRASYTVTPEEIQGLFSLTEDDYTGGDRFIIRFELVLTDGRVFTNTNANNVILGGPFYDSPFVYNVNITCPVPDGAYTGAYTVTAVDLGVLGIPVWGVGDVVTIELGNSLTSRVFEVQHIPAAGVGQPPTPFAFDLLCNNVIVFSGQGTGLTCGSGGLFYGPAPDGSVATYNPDDDSTLTITFTDNEVSDCGEGPRVINATLTKN